MVYVAFCAAGVLAFLGAGLLVWACRDYARSAERSAMHALDDRLRVERALSEDWRRRRAAGECVLGVQEYAPDEVQDGGWVQLPTHDLGDPVG